MENIDTDTLSVICEYLNEDFISFAPVSILFRKQWGDKKKKTRALTKYSSHELVSLSIQMGLKKRTDTTCILSRYVRDNKGSLDLLKMSLLNGYPWSIQAWDILNEKDSHEILKFIKKNGCKWGRLKYYYSIEQIKNSEKLKCALKNGCNFDKHIYIKSASQNDLKGMKMLFKFGLKIDKRETAICDYASRLDNFEFLKWARKSGFRWGNYVCANASRNGNLKMLKWARKNKCPWGMCFWREAFRGGNMDIVLWAKENGCKFKPTNDLPMWAVENGHLEIVKWAHENGCKVTKGLFKVSVANDHLEILKWCSQHNKKWDISGCYDLAIQKSKTRIAEWIKTNYLFHNEHLLL